jgi:ASC-1-like (ASCH) protein
MIVFSSSVTLSNPISKRLGGESCTVEADPNKARNYLIYVENDESNEQTLFGQLSYELCSYDNYLYTIVIGRKLYKVRSCDLKDRRLSIVDTIQQNNNSGSDQYSAMQCPETLFQVIDSFSKSNKTYHVTINDKENQFGYLAISILLHLHECKRN